MNYHNITYPDMNNGDGLRVVLWLSGCSHQCIGCQNPQTWDPHSGIPFNIETKEELFKELDKNYISGITLTGGDPLYEENLDDTLDLVDEINNKYNILNKNGNEIRLSSPTKSIWLYTGYTWNQIINHHSAITDEFDYIEESYINSLFEKRKEIVSKCDVLIDGRYIEQQRNITLKWRGSENQNVIDIQKSLIEGRKVLWCN